MKHSRQRHLFWPATALAILAVTRLLADPAPNSASAKFSAPDKPAKLTINLNQANLVIVGTDGDTVTVESLSAPPTAGLRRLDEETPLSLTEQGNTISLTDNDSPLRDLKVTVPRHVAVKCSVHRSESGVTVRDLTGEVEIDTFNGNIRLENISGPLIASSLATGSIYVRNSAPPRNVISLMSLGGSIDLQLPPETKANVRLRTNERQGAIFTDFDAAKLKTTTQKGRRNSEARSQTVAEPSSGYGLIINVRLDGVFTLGTAITPATLDEVTQAAAAEFAHDKNSGAIVIYQERADPWLIQKIWDACQKAGLTKNSAMSAQDFSRQFSLANRESLAIGGKQVSGTLNGGGADIAAFSYNGKITLQQIKPVSATTADSKTQDNITVTFLDPDKFTDVDEDFPGSPSTAYLGVLRDYVQQTAGPLLPAGSKLTVTFLDVDLAGMIRPDRNNIRFLTGTTIPRAHLRFQLVAADGQVLKEGERKLSDMHYQMNIGIIGRNEELYYDKELLKEWIYQEFPKGS